MMYAMSGRESGVKIVQWNISKKDQPMYGAKRYEDELYNNIKARQEGIEIERIQRSGNGISGNTVASWLLSYKPKDADIVHATCQTVAPAAYIRRPQRFIVTVLDLIPLLYPSVLKSDLSMRLQWLLTPGALKKADAIITISEFTKKEVIRLLGINESRIFVVHLAADRTKYRPMNKIECKQKFGLNASEKHILVLASNNQNKRMDLVQKIINGVRKQRKDIKLIKAGYAEHLSGEGIINAGWVSEDDMPALYNSADVFLNTSEYEGFCLPVLEAMSCGIPIVASNRASIPEIVGQSGKLVDINAENAIEQYVDNILSCIDAGRDERAIEQSQKFSWERMAEETIKVYRKLYLM
jgi:glycosyltransferase involved in cell wall biosynthesis